ncbi:hypothetical protein E2C01_023900 [Portunus trituberculatus]|uniref:Uncharacterized protein n=1 Tax=Portunus trituberculatus TaxID=210409 RepID=A0A5B7E9C8_PORTR|nr:hypothetical protein [Portunus trituberculatus]
MTRAAVGVDGGEDMSRKEQRGGDTLVHLLSSGKFEQCLVCVEAVGAGGNRGSCSEDWVQPERVMVGRYRFTPAMFRGARST